MTPSKMKEVGRDMPMTSNLKFLPINIWDFDYSTLMWFNPRIRGIELARTATKVTLDGKDFVSKAYLDSSTKEFRDEEIRFILEDKV